MTAMTISLSVWPRTWDLGLSCVRGWRRLLGVSGASREGGGSVGGVGGADDEMCHGVGVGHHRYVRRRDFDGGGAGALGHIPLGRWRDRLGVAGGQLPGGDRPPSPETGSPRRD